MPFTRKMLAAKGLEPDVIDEIMAAHVEVVNALKDERDTLKTEADKVATLQEELDTMKQTGGGWKKKYEDEHTALEQLKADYADAETKRRKADIYRDALRKAGVPEKLLDALLKIAPVDSVEIGADGAAKNIGDIEKGIKETFGDYIQTKREALDKPDTPPATATGKDAFNAMTLTEKMRYANEHPAEAAEYMKGV